MKSFLVTILEIGLVVAFAVTALRGLVHSPAQVHYEEEEATDYATCGLLLLLFGVHHVSELVKWSGRSREARNKCH